MSLHDREAKTELVAAGAAWCAFVILGGLAGFATYVLLAAAKSIVLASIALPSAILVGGVLGTLGAVVPPLRQLVIAIFIPDWA